MATLTLKSSTSCYTEAEWCDYENMPPSRDIEQGVTVEYLGHLPGGMVQVRHGDEILVLHPAATVELS